VGANGIGTGLNIEVWLDYGRTVVELVGDVDVYATADLRSELFSLSSEHARRVVVMLAGVKFMDSSGLGVLVGAVKRARALGGAVVLVEPREHLVKVLRMTGLTPRVLPVCASLEDALAHLDTL
jgi:anti-sigma B factor antagonist